MEVDLHVLNKQQLCSIVLGLCDRAVLLCVTVQRRGEMGRQMVRKEKGFNPTVAYGTCMSCIPALLSQYKLSHFPLTLHPKSSLVQHDVNFSKYGLI